MTQQPERERDVLAELAKRYGQAPTGQVWVGDDAALIAPLQRPLVCSDLIVEGVHVDRQWCSFEDMGWKAVSVNVSDIAAMGGSTRAVLVAIAGATAAEIRQIMDGAEEAAERYGCDIVGGDLTDGTTLVICVTAIGESGPTPVLRSGARPGDSLYLTGPVGASSAGLRLLQGNPDASGPLVSTHRRPMARAAEGVVLGRLGVHAMLDCSDGLVGALQTLAEESQVCVELKALPCAEGATRDEALDGGEDYELLYASSHEVDAAFSTAGLTTPVWIGLVAEGPAGVFFEGERLRSMGYEHRFAEKDEHTRG